MGLTAASTRHSARGMATMHATLVRGGFGMEGLHFAAVLVLMAAITYATTPDSLVVKDPNVGHVWFYGWLAAITTGLGALPGCRSFSSARIPATGLACPTSWRWA